ncbi:hypothetical protein EJ06DRAFT_557281 [Trichodelitschia bisporula]|uniref:Uncharacterized protein n=1 Tax=Trichodelitschia bisporula TaxID=703511 RepID=A0A6G1HU55_9PEZI|nr:hypothetical protein EJ06DRAFT_557281 [Trichodelitschia bisporula]
MVSPFETRGYEESEPDEESREIDSGDSDSDSVRDSGSDSARYSNSDSVRYSDSDEVRYSDLDEVRYSDSDEPTRCNLRRTSRRTSPARTSRAAQSLMPGLKATNNAYYSQKFKRRPPKSRFCGPPETSRSFTGTPLTGPEQ